MRKIAFVFLCAIFSQNAFALIPVIHNPDGTAYYKVCENRFSAILGNSECVMRYIACDPQFNNIYESPFNYDPLNDRYTKSDWRLELHEVNGIRSLKDIPGTHNEGYNRIKAQMVQHLGSLPQRDALGCFTTVNVIDGRSRGLDYIQQRVACDCPDPRWFTTNDPGYLADDYLEKTCGYLSSALKYVLNIYNSNNTLVASAYLIKSPRNANPWNHPIIMSDGFDPGNTRTIYELAYSKQFNLFLQLDGETPLAKGYDVCFVDFAVGDDDIRKNSKAFLRIIEEFCTRGNGSVVVGGFSMGGQVSRLALLYGQKKNSNGNPSAQILQVKKFISIDSPNKGAGALSLSFQNLVKKQMPEQYWNLNNPAAKQMLFNHAESDPYSNPQKTMLEHDEFYAFLSDMGNFPRGMELHCIADANWVKPCNETSLSWQFNVSVTYSPSNALTVGSATIFAGFFALGLPSPFPIFLPLPLPFQFYQVNQDIPMATVTFAGQDLEAGSSMSILNDFLIPGGETSSQLVSQFADISKYGYGILGSLNPIHKLGSFQSASNVEPTFMPVSSVFCLKDNTPENLKNADNLDRLVSEGWTPFNKLYLTTNRHEHIEFEPELMSQVLKALGPRNKDISPIINLLLGD